MKILSRKVGLLAVLVAMLGLTIAPLGAQDTPELSIVWFAWPPCDLLDTITDDYPDATVTVTCVPIDQWFDQIFLDFASQGGADLPILDSQFMGAAVAGGHVVNLTDWMGENLPLDDYVPAALSAYGEVPVGSGDLYAVPMMTDTRMLVYRTDLFEEKGFEPPTSWTELLSHAQAFQADGVSGFATHWNPGGDLVATTWNHILWSFGGELWDPETYTVEGVLNTEEAVSAIEMANALWQTAPTGAGSFGFDEVVGAMCNGSTAMVEIWYGFGGAFTSTESCEYADRIGFAVVPGEEEHFISLGGMGISLSQYSENPEAALALVAWLQSDEVQERWASSGGFPARVSVLESEAFQNAAPYTPSFAEAFQLVKDFWNLPEYNTLLGIQQEYLNLAITGDLGAQEALDLIAAEQQELLDEAYGEEE
ncbi:MAG: extracellular solute-binding protein [Anaerolineae bacterium]|nr:extracellular solute-binding protein [Anaerolineae bacterium]